MSTDEHGDPDCAPAEAAAPEGGAMVTVADPRRTCLLGLLMRDMIATRLEGPGMRAKASALRGDFRVSAGGMTVTLRAAGGRLTILEGEHASPRAGVAGTLPALLGFVSGGGMLGPLLAGEIKVSGNPLALIGLMPLMRG